MHILSALKSGAVMNVNAPVIPALENTVPLSYILTPPYRYELSIVNCVCTDFFTGIEDQSLRFQFKQAWI
jgi:hypothetical protein